MTLNDAALEPHAWERVFNLKGIGLCSIFTILYAYEPESERKIEKNWNKNVNVLFCYKRVFG